MWYLQNMVGLDVLLLKTFKTAVPLDRDERDSFSRLRLVVIGRRKRCVELASGGWKKGEGVGSLSRDVI